MIDLTLAEIADITGGQLHGVDPQVRATAPVEFDSRRVVPGGLFLALRGERADGHDYVAQAIADGAVAAIVTRPVDAPSIEVADGYAALAALASAVARRLAQMTVVAITGSTGKTSTKDLLAQLLERLGPTVAPPESFNNELGHPYTVLMSTVDTRFLVLEASARGIGHIRHLADIAPPRIGVVLNVGSAHLGMFGSREVIAQAKGELVEALPAAQDGGVAVLNACDSIVAAMAARTAARVVTFGDPEHSDLYASDVRLDDLARPSFRLHMRDGSADVVLRLSGEHQVSNALAAAAVALECGMSLPDAAAALSEARARSGRRMERHERRDGVLILNDAYNASPESMRAALDVLTWMGRQRQGRTWAVLGPMAELGDAAQREHEAIGQLVAQMPIARLVTVGEQAQTIADAAGRDGTWAGESVSVPDTDAAIALLHAQVRPGDVVLVKASRAASLERIAQALSDDQRGDTAEDAQ